MTGDTEAIGADEVVPDDEIIADEVPGDGVIENDDHPAAGAAGDKAGPARPFDLGDLSGTAARQAPPASTTPASTAPAGAAPGKTDFAALIDQFFGQQHATASPDADLEVRHTVTFEQAFAGTTVTLRPEGIAGRPVDVRIPRGVRDGQRVSFTGMGARRPPGGYGDLHVTVTVDTGKEQSVTLTAPAGRD